MQLVFTAKQVHVSANHIVHPNGWCRYDDNSQIAGKEGVTMENIWSAIASLIEAIANMGAGAASSTVSFEPELPEELRK